MIQTLEGVIDQQGVLRLLEPVKLPPLRRVFITILDEEPELSARICYVERTCVSG